MTLTGFRAEKKQKTIVTTEAQVVAVWGPVGSTGKTTVALNLAFELACLGRRVLLLDVDTVAPALALLLGVKDPVAGLAGAARLIRQGRLTPEEVDRLSVLIRHKRTSFRFLPGLSNPVRWPEITPETILQLINIAKQNFDFIIADLASGLEDQLTSPEHSTLRNSATRTALANATRAVTVIQGTELSLSRYINNFSALEELQKTRHLVINKAEPTSAFVSAIRTLTKERITASIPSDEPTMQLAESGNLPIALARRKSPAGNAIASLAHKLLEWPSVN